MQFRNTPDRFGLISQSLHWLTVVLVVVVWFLGNVGDDRSPALFAHMSLGVAILGVLIARMLWRLQDPPPKPVNTPLGRWSDWLALATHVLLYTLVAAAPCPASRPSLRAVRLWPFSASRSPRPSRFLALRRVRSRKCTRFLPMRSCSSPWHMPRPRFSITGSFTTER